MIATLPYIAERFQTFNSLMFDGKLPAVRIGLSHARTFVGVLTSKRKRNWLGRTVHYDYQLKISTRFDLPQQELDDIIIHEMIHYYIAVNGLKDSSAHGRLFRQMMNDINSRFGRHITISHHLTHDEKSHLLDNTPRYHKVAIITFTNGRTGIKILPKAESSQRYYLSTVGRSPKVSRIEVVETMDPYFNRFPQSSALNAVYVDRDILQRLESKMTSCLVT